MRVLKVTCGLSASLSGQQPSAKAQVMLRYSIQSQTHHSLSSAMVNLLFSVPIELQHGDCLDCSLLHIPAAAQRQACPGLIHSYSSLCLQVSFVHQELMNSLTDLSTYCKFILF